MKTENNDRQKEEFIVKATLNDSGKEILDVLCKIILPDRITEKPKLEFKPTSEQYQKMRDSHEVSFNAQIKGFDKETEISFFSPKVHLFNKESKSWGPDCQEFFFMGEPEHFQVRHHLKPEPIPQITSFTLWLSPNPMLRPTMICGSDFSGGIFYERVAQLQFALSEKIFIKFDNNFKTKKIADGEILQWSYLIGITDQNLPAIEVESFNKKILPQVEDFLIIASLGSRTRTACIGWQAIDRKDMVTYYRGEFSFPSGRSEWSFRNGLVEQGDFEDFMNICYAAFLKSPDLNAIRQAIFSIVPQRERTIEGSFLSMFAGLESLGVCRA